MSVVFQAMTRSSALTCDDPQPHRAAGASREGLAASRGESRTGGAGHDFGRVAVDTRAPVMPADVADVVASPGAPLDLPVRRDMERGFGVDFSRVRVHADSRAARSAASIGARAYAVGPHVVLGRGAGAAGTAAARESLAHELAHVARRGHATVAPARLRLGDAQDPEERAAEAPARDVIDTAGPAAAARGTAPPGEAGVIRRQLEPGSRQPGSGGTDVMGQEPVIPMTSGSWASSSASINLTPPNVPRDPSSRSDREPVWCQYGGDDRGDECKPLQACRTTASSTFVLHAVYRVDSPPPSPAYPSRFHGQPIEVAGDFHYEPASGGQQPIGAFAETVRYGGHGRPVHVHTVSFSTRESGLLVYTLTVRMPAEVVVYNGSTECTLANCV